MAQATLVTRDDFLVSSIARRTNEQSKNTREPTHNQHLILSDNLHRRRRCDVLRGGSKKAPSKTQTPLPRGSVSFLTEPVFAPVFRRTTELESDVKFCFPSCLPPLAAGKDLARSL